MSNYIGRKATKLEKAIHITATVALDLDKISSRVKNRAAKALETGVMDALNGQAVELFRNLYSPNRPYLLHSHHQWQLHLPAGTDWRAGAKLIRDELNAAAMLASRKPGQRVYDFAHDGRPVFYSYCRMPPEIILRHSVEKFGWKVGDERAAKRLMRGGTIVVEEWK